MYVSFAPYTLHSHEVWVIYFGVFFKDAYATERHLLWSCCSFYLLFRSLYYCYVFMAINE